MAASLLNWNTRRDQKAPTGSDIEYVIILSENAVEFLIWLQLDQSKIAEMHLMLQQNKLKIL